MSISDVVIHVEEAMTPTSRSALECTLREMDGVIAPRFNPKQEHLLVVAFNPHQTRATRLLDAVSKAGYHAHLIGM